MVDLPDITRRQLLVWAVVGLVIALIGGRYLLGDDVSGEDQLLVPAATSTVGLKEEQATAIKVHVVGAVVSPGLYDLEKGCRVADAVTVAGGPLPSADLSRINLAARLADGQQLAVPDANDAVAVAAGQVGAAVDQGPINLNSATPEELAELDGIGPKTAQKIVDYREEHGGFDHIEQLMEVPGIGPAKFDQVKDRIIV